MWIKKGAAVLLPAPFGCYRFLFFLGGWFLYHPLPLLFAFRLHQAGDEVFCLRGAKVFPFRSDPLVCWKRRTDPLII